MTVNSIRLLAVSVTLGAPWVMTYLSQQLGETYYLAAGVTGFIVVLFGLAFTLHAQDFADEN